MPPDYYGLSLPASVSFLERIATRYHPELNQEVPSVDRGLWTVDRGLSPWTVDCRLWTVNPGTYFRFRKYLSLFARKSKTAL